PTSTTASPTFTPPNYQQQLELAQIQPMLEQQRTEIEQLKVQMQNQQLLIDSLTSQVDNKSLPSWENPESAIANSGIASSAQPEIQQQENKLVSGIIWALGGIAITMSGGVVVLGALALLLRQQRPPRTTYVVQNPYNSLPPSVSPRRRSEFVQPQYDDRRIDQMDY
ncbi:MAG: hypothetical protein F6K09_29845, partial [Merismopedia sp. SIO2A8]|nr:hypothetical protein [Merismopedia sp. SIO2A8]